MKKAKSTAIILAAGQGKRMKTTVPKLYLEIDGKPVLYYTLKAFQESGIIDDIVLVVGKGQTGRVQKEIVDLYGFSKVSTIVEGGTKRYDSVWKGLQHIHSEDRESDSYVFIHDGARALIDGEIIQRVYESVLVYKACVVAMPVKDTIKIADEQDMVQETPNRKQVWQIQTPQAFQTNLIKEAYAEFMKAPDTMVTDDSMVVERMKPYNIKLVKGSYENMKITTPEDILLAEQLLHGLTKF